MTANTHAGEFGRVVGANWAMKVVALALGAALIAGGLWVRHERAGTSAPPLTSPPVTSIGTEDPPVTAQAPPSSAPSSAPGPTSLSFVLPSAPTSLAMGDAARTSVWVGTRGGTLLEIDAESGEELDRFDIGTEILGVGALLGLVYIEAAPGMHVWEPNTKIRREVVLPTDADLQPSTSVYGFGAVWVPDTDGTAFLRLNFATLDVAARVPLDSTFTAGIAFKAADAVWVVAHGSAPARSRLFRIDPQTNTVSGSVDVNGQVTAGGWGPLGTWLGDSNGRLLRVVEDPELRIETGASLGACADLLAVTDDAVWTACGNALTGTTEPDGESSQARRDTCNVSGCRVTALATDGEVLWNTSADDNGYAAMGVFWLEDQ